jgi:hypothetical protein
MNFFEISAIKAVVTNPICVIAIIKTSSNYDKFWSMAYNYRWQSNQFNLNWCIL